LHEVWIGSLLILLPFHFHLLASLAIQIYFLITLLFDQLITWEISLQLLIRDDLLFRWFSGGCGRRSFNSDDGIGRFLHQEKAQKITSSIRDGKRLRVVPDWNIRVQLIGISSFHDHTGAHNLLATDLDTPGAVL
jgi:hypothetical protein